MQRGKRAVEDLDLGVRVEDEHVGQLEELVEHASRAVALRLDLRAKPRLFPPAVRGGHTPADQSDRPHAPTEVDYPGTAPPGQDKGTFPWQVGAAVYALAVT